MTKAANLAASANATAGNVTATAIQSNAASTPTLFKDSAGTEVGTLCRAWINYKGSATQTIRASFNVSSVTRNSTGNYTINFTNALPDANYSVVGTCSVDLTGVVRVLNAPYSSAPTTTALRFVTTASNGTAEDQDYISVSVFR